MKILIATDSFKGSISAKEAAESIYRGVVKACPESEVTKFALSDGGEGLVECLVAATGGELIVKNVTDPMGKKLNAAFGLLGDGKTVVIEMASASGLLLIPEEYRDPLVATSFGTGELIKAALDEGCSKIILGLGGSATNDGGSGMVQALGAKLLKKDGSPIPFGGKALLELHSIDISNLDHRLKKVEIQAACDVDNILTGKLGASHVFGPQKGANSKSVLELDRSLKHFANIIKRDLKQDVEFMPGAGAAGGVGASVVAFLQGKLTSGINLVIEAVGLKEHLNDCDLVITGEGKLDAQSAYGKVPIGVARLAKEYDVPVIAVAGNVYNEDDCLAFHNKGITAYFSIINEPMSLDAAMGKGAYLLEFTTNQLIKLFCAGYWKKPM